MYKNPLTADYANITMTEDIDLPKDFYDPDKRRQSILNEFEKDLKDIEAMVQNEVEKNKERYDVTTLRLIVIQKQVVELEKDVNKCDKSHFTKTYRTLQGLCTKLQTELDELDFSGRDELRTKKKETVIIISKLANNLAMAVEKTHTNGVSCDLCEI